MFGKVVESLEKASARAAFRKGAMRCPDCGAKPVELPAEWEGLITCPSCGIKASVPEWAAGSESGRLMGDADRPPAATAIRKETTGENAATWHMPAKGKFGFFMVFAVLWLGITVLVSGGFLFAILTGGKIEGNMPTWALIPFFGIFYAVGFGMLYAGLREKFMSQSLSVGGGNITLKTRMFGREKSKSFPRNDRTSVSQKEFYQQNYKPVYGIEIKADGGKLRFGSTLTEDEKAWLVADIRNVIQKKPDGAAGEASGVTLTMKVTKPQAAFSIPIPGPGKSAIIASLLFAIIGIAFFCIGLFVIESRSVSGESGSAQGIGLIFSLMENGFRTIWLLMSGVFAVIGIAMTGHTFMQMGKDRRIEGNASGISIRTYRRGLVFGEVSFPRHQVTDIRASQSGSNNGSPMKRVELIVGERAEKIASWMDGDQADALVADVRNALGVRH